MDLVIRVTMLIAIPCAVGVAVMGGPIMQMLFRDTTTLPGRMLIIGAVTIVFYALSTLTSTILQASNHMRIPVINAEFPWHTYCIYRCSSGLCRFTYFCFDLRQYRIFIQYVCLNLRSLAKLINYQLDIVKMCGATVIASAIMGAVTFFVYKEAFI